MPAIACSRVIIWTGILGRIAVRMLSLMRCAFEEVSRLLFEIMYLLLLFLDKS